MDILIYNSSQYPVFQRFGDTVIVPPVGVIGVISVKKTLYENNIEDELKALKNVSKLCYTTNDEKKKIRGPFLALVAMDSFEKKTINTQNWIFNKIKEIYDKEKDQKTFQKQNTYILNIIVQKRYIWDSNFY